MSLINCYRLVSILLTTIAVLGFATPKAQASLLVASNATNSVLEYDEITGAFIKTFISSGSGGLKEPLDLTFGPDGNLYVVSRATDSILKYNGTTGEFINAFVQSGSGGLKNPIDLDFGSDGNLYVSNSGLNGGFGEPAPINNSANNVLKYNGTTGEFINRPLA
jgi:DNA-binding beta-propeller fold protein YncE